MRQLQSRKNQLLEILCIHSQYFFIQNNEVPSISFGTFVTKFLCLIDDCYRNIKK